jgi:hypothetical protein
VRTVALVEIGPAASTGVDGCACVGGCVCGVNAPPIADPQARRWAWWLTAATISWNSLEAVIAIVGGVLAGSIALVGFGLDSVVEVASALVIVWRLSQRTADHVAQEVSVRLVAHEPSTPLETALAPVGGGHWLAAAGGQRSNPGSGALVRRSLSIGRG